MAEHVLPEHKPHDQLRTEAPKQRPHTDKYVSAFVTGKNVTELTFKNPILGESADHFKVGIDDLTVNLGSLSMLDYSDPTEVMFRIIRRGVTDHPATNADERSDAAARRGFVMPDYILDGSVAEQEMAAHQLTFGNAFNALAGITQANLAIAAAAAIGDNVALAQAQADLAIAQALHAQGPAALAAMNALIAPGSQRATFRDGFEFKVDRVFVSLVEIMERFIEIASAVNSYIHSYGLLDQDPNSPGYVLWNELANGAYFPVGNRHEFLRFGLTSNGQLKISASRIFWMNFVLEVPLEKYREILFKDSNRRFVSLHPGSGSLEPYSESYPAVDLAAVPPTFSAVPLHNWDREVLDANERPIEYVGSGMLFSTMDRRVTLEVGCSLPVKNSPLIDHGVEAPDYVLGRYMFHKPYTVAEGEYSQESVGVQTIQGSRDRVVFHHLRPQQKIQTLRLRLWVRVRKYNTITKQWGMETILCPIDPQDYWHIRLQFVSKD